MEEAVHLRGVMVGREKRGKSGRSGATAGKSDSASMAKAIHAFLIAAGLDPDSDPELRETPARVALAWTEDFLDGYRADIAEILAGVHPTTSREMVITTGIDFHSMCPHHLLPYRGRAHVAYVPKDGVVGFGKLVHLVDACAHRLELQEQVADDVADALMKHLGARGAACVLDAEQGCLTMRGPKRRDARTITRAFRGTLAKDTSLQAAFLAAIGKSKR